MVLTATVGGDTVLVVEAADTSPLSAPGAAAASSGAMVVDQSTSPDAPAGGSQRVRCVMACHRGACCKQEACTARAAPTRTCSRHVVGRRRLCQRAACRHQQHEEQRVASRHHGRHHHCRAVQARSQSGCCGSSSSGGGRFSRVAACTRSTHHTAGDDIDGMQQWMAAGIVSSQQAEAGARGPRQLPAGLLKSCSGGRCGLARRLQLCGRCSPRLASVLRV